MKTFLQLKQDVLRYFDVAGEPSDSADVVLVETALNMANQHRVTEERWKFRLSPVYTLNVVAGQTEYILPQPSMAELQYLWSVTNQCFAHSVPMRDVPGTGVFQSTSGTSSKYYDINNSQSHVKMQPSAPDVLQLTSTAAEGNSLYIEGEDEDGAEISETLAVDGETTQEFARVNYVAKTGDFSGTLTLTTAGGDELLVLTASEYGKEYPVLKFYNTPSASEVFEYRFFKKPRTMALDYDRPDVPFPLCNILVYDALLDLATYNELDSESVNIWRDKQQELLSDLYQQKLEGNTVAGLGAVITRG